MTTENVTSAMALQRVAKYKLIVSTLKGFDVNARYVAHDTSEHNDGVQHYVTWKVYCPRRGNITVLVFAKIGHDGALLECWPFMQANGNENIHPLAESLSDLV